MTSQLNIGDNDNWSHIIMRNLFNSGFWTIYLFSQKPLDMFSSDGALL